MAYSSKQRAEALATLEANGGNLRKTSRELKIGLATISAWRSESRTVKSNRTPEHAPTRTQEGARSETYAKEARTKDGETVHDITSAGNFIEAQAVAVEAEELLPAVRGDFIRDLTSLRARLLAHLSDNLENLSAKDTAIALGIVIDKVELLEGNATSRTAIINGGSIDEAIERLTLELNDRAARTGGASILEVESSTDRTSTGEPEASE